MVERAVATIKDIDLRVVQCRVAMRVLFAILGAHELSPRLVRTGTQGKYKL